MKKLIIAKNLLPTHYALVEQPFYQGNGNHSVSELERICSEYKEYAHQMQIKQQKLLEFLNAEIVVEPFLYNKDLLEFVLDNKPSDDLYLFGCQTTSCLYQISILEPSSEINIFWVYDNEKEYKHDTEMLTRLGY